MFFQIYDNLKPKCYKRISVMFDNCRQIFFLPVPNQISESPLYVQIFFIAICIELWQIINQQELFKKKVNAWNDNNLPG